MGAYYAPYLNEVNAMGIAELQKQKVMLDEQLDKTAETLLGCGFRFEVFSTCLGELIDILKDHKGQIDKIKKKVE